MILQPGETCTLTVFAAQVVDDDAVDPPNNMAADFVTSFNVDAAPSVTSVVPPNGATKVASNATITVNFSEPMDIAARGITLNRGAPVNFNARKVESQGGTRTRFSVRIPPLRRKANRNHAITRA